MSDWNTKADQAAAEQAARAAGINKGDFSEFQKGFKNQGSIEEKMQCDGVEVPQTPYCKGLKSRGMDDEM